MKTGVFQTRAMKSSAESIRRGLMGSNPIKGHFGTIRVRAACLQLSSKALGLRLPLDHELVLPGFGAVVREAQEVEGLRASLPSGGSLVGGEPQELDQPGLALMERQAELQQPVFEIHEELLPICLELTAEHHIICVPTDDHRPGCPPSSPLVNPEIDDVVKKNIRKDGADPRPLRSARLQSMRAFSPHPLDRGRRSKPAHRYI